ncbi:MAG: hypothetical protein QM820_08215 [Minicystis sp.]
MTKLSSFVLVALAPFFAAGCGCTDVGCQGGVSALIHGFSSSFDAYPLTLKLCIDTRCGEFTVDKDAAGVLTCTTPGFCTDTNGDLEVELLPPTSGTGEEPELGDTAHVTIDIKSTGGDVLFSDATDVPITDASLNGPFCGTTCRGGLASFTPVSK